MFGGMKCFDILDLLSFFVTLQWLRYCHFLKRYLIIFITIYYDVSFITECLINVFVVIFNYLAHWITGIMSSGDLLTSDNLSISEITHVHKHLQHKYWQRNSQRCSNPSFFFKDTINLWIPLMNVLDSDIILQVTNHLCTVHILAINWFNFYIKVCLYLQTCQHLDKIYQYSWHIMHVI